MKRMQVRDQLRALIDDREPGELLPSERDLSEKFGVSRPTLRAAIDDLARDGLLVRRPGRGTFTNARTVSQDLAPTVNPNEFAVPPAEGAWGSRVEFFAREAAGPRLGQRMQLSPSAELLCVQRVRIVDGAPMAIETLRLPADLVPGMEFGDFETGSLYQLLRLRYGLTATTAVQTTEPTVTDAVEAALLHVPLHSPALLFARTTKDPDGRIIEYTRSVYRGDRYRITAHLTFDATSG